MKDNMEKEEEIWYVRIRDPIEFRRFILECLKDVIQLLQMCEELKKVREKKIEEMAQLKDTIAEMTKLNSQLKLELPQTRISSSKEIRAVSVNAPSITRKSQLERLENELEDIESKLKSLT